MTASTDRFDSLRQRPYAEVLIIGGGINGLATFRDLAMQGVDVALVERADYVSGASAASSHMIHGGIRYLENGEFRLVHEAVTERNNLLRIAPHYVRPLQTTIPLFTTFSGVLAAPLRFLRHGSARPRERGALLIKVGLVIYDSFSRGGGRVPRHTIHGRTRSLREMPDLNPALKYTANYWDASLHDPERLAIDVLRDGLAAGGDRARAANYTSAVGSWDGKIVLRDGMSGEEFEFAASVVVNASGPWTDVTNDSLGDHTQYMGGTKGSHIVLEHEQLLAATGGRELFFEHSDGRIVLIYPLKGRVLVGTTDLEHNMRDAIECTEEEVDYFFDLIKHVFPEIAVDRSQIVYRFAGVRPLPGHGDLAPRFRLARLPHRIAAAGWVDRCQRAESRRRQVDDVPRLGRTPDRSRSGPPRPASSALDQERADRRRQGLPDGRARTARMARRVRRRNRLRAGSCPPRPLRHRRRGRRRCARLRRRRCPLDHGSRVRRGGASLPGPHRGRRPPRRPAHAENQHGVHGGCDRGVSGGGRGRDRAGHGVGCRHDGR